LVSGFCLSSGIIKTTQCCGNLVCFCLQVSGMGGGAPTELGVTNCCSKPLANLLLLVIQLTFENCMNFIIYFSCNIVTVLY
jgi:hypothetical protein